MVGERKEVGSYANEWSPPETTPPRPSGDATHITYKPQLIMPLSDPSVDTASYDTDDDDEYRLAQQEWRESVEELQQLALVLLLPWLGKFLGRKTSHWRAFHLLLSSSVLTFATVYARYLRLGIGMSFFLGDRPLALPLFSR